MPKLDDIFESLTFFGFEEEKIFFCSIRLIFFLLVANPDDDAGSQAHDKKKQHIKEKKSLPGTFGANRTLRSD